jgi:RecA/RadA recombinase
LIIIDSLANIVPRAELEGSYEDMQVALQARLIAKLFRKLSNVLVKEYKRGHLVSVLAINQMRAIIGAGRFEPSETTPGGWASKHGYRLSVRVGQLMPDREKGEMDKTSGERHVLRFSASLLGAQGKQQMFTMGTKCEYKVTMTEFNGYPSGSILDAASTIGIARNLGILENSGKSYILAGTDMRWSKLSEIDEVFQTGMYKGKYGMDDVMRYLVVKTARQRRVQELVESFNRRVQVIANPNKDL